MLVCEVEGSCIDKLTLHLSVVSSDRVTSRDVNRVRKHVGDPGDVYERDHTAGEGALDNLWRCSNTAFCVFPKELHNFTVEVTGDDSLDRLVVVTLGVGYYRDFVFCSVYLRNNAHL